MYSSSSMMNLDVTNSDEFVDRRPSVSFKIPASSSSEGDLSILYGDQSSDFEDVMERSFSTNIEIVDKGVTYSDADDYNNYRRRDSMASTLRNSALPMNNVLIAVSVIYAFVMTIIGLVIPISEALTDAWLDTVYGAVFLSYQLVIGCFFLLFLQFHHLIKKQWFPFFNLQGDDSADDSNGNDNSRSKGASANRRSSISSSTMWVDMSAFGDIFTHSETSLFLRVGTLVFSLGNLIYYGFEIASYMTMDNVCGSKCLHGWTFYLRFLFILLQTYFLFKNNKICLNKHISSLWFGMLHLASTNICLWFRTVVYELMEEVKYFSTDHPDYAITDGVTDTTLQNDAASNVSTVDCVDEVLDTLSVYLCPFILEYSLIAVGTITSLLHVMTAEKNDHGHRTQDIRNNFRVVALKRRKAATSCDDEEEEQHLSSQSRHEENILGKSHRGFFAAALVVAGLVAAVILFYLMPKASDDNWLPSVIYYATDLCLHVFLLCGCMLGFLQMMPLGFVPKTISTDDVLLLIAMCGSVMYDVAAIIASSHALDQRNEDSIIDVLRLSSSLVTFVQVIVQSLFLSCSLRRYPSDTDHVERKPGRGAITALVIGNAALWVFWTILAKGSDMQAQEKFYGEVPWLMLMDINMPLSLFFCFHSSICFADVWHHAYAPLECDNSSSSNSRQMSRCSSVSNILDSRSDQKPPTNNPPPPTLTLSPIFSVS